MLVERSELLAVMVKQEPDLKGKKANSMIHLIAWSQFLGCKAGRGQLNRDQWSHWVEETEISVRSQGGQNLLGSVQERRKKHTQRALQICDESPWVLTLAELIWEGVRNQSNQDMNNWKIVVEWMIHRSYVGLGIASVATGKSGNNSWCLRYQAKSSKGYCLSSEVKLFVSQKLLGTSLTKLKSKTWEDQTNSKKLGSALA